MLIHLIVALGHTEDVSGAPLDFAGPDDVDYFHRPVGVPLPCAGDGLGLADYPISATSNDVGRPPTSISLPLAAGLPVLG
jgi:hypothetical protein